MMKHQLARYDTYKKTDSYWFDEAPFHWTSGRIKDFVDLKAITKVPTNLVDDDLVEFLPMTNVNEDLGKIKQFNFVPLKEVSSGYTKFRNGDVIFAKITPCMENGNCAIVHGLTYDISFGSTEFMVFRPLRKLIQKYLQYFLHNELLRKNAEPFMKGTAGQKRISSHYMATHYFALPPSLDQKAIASYLYTKTAQIDRKIDLLTQKATQYGKLKQSLINETVTRGLDKTVVMKDSGVEWIGEIPIHWEVTRNKDIFEERGNLSNSGTETLLTVSHITGVTRRTEKNVNMFMAETMKGYKLCEKGDLIINTMWAWMGALGTCSENGICSPAYGVYKSKKYKSYNHRYFDYLYRTPNSITEMTKNSKGIVSSRLRLYPKEFFQIKTALPNYAEQKAIADYLDTKTGHIGRIIETINTQIEKLKELRKTLINDVVTGKIKVA